MGIETWQEQNPTEAQAARRRGGQASQAVQREKREQNYRRVRIERGLDPHPPEAHPLRMWPTLILETIADGFPGDRLGIDGGTIHLPLGVEWPADWPMALHVSATQFLVFRISGTVWDGQRYRKIWCKYGEPEFPTHRVESTQGLFERGEQERSGHIVERPTLDYPEPSKRPAIPMPEGEPFTEYIDPTTSTFPSRWRP